MNKSSKTTDKIMSEKTVFSNSIDANPSWQNGGKGTRDKDSLEVSCELHRAFINKSEKSLTDSVDLLAKAMDARSAMDVMAESWKISHDDFQVTSGERLKQLRMTRMAMDSEIRQLMASLREVREFFIDKDHASEVARLKKFVDLCERLKALKESGFLDTVADTMLRLA
jgi:hypothetical protein